MTIARKLSLMVAVGLSALIFVTGFSAYTTYQIEQGYQEVFRTDYRQVELALGALGHMGDAVHAFKNCLIRNDLTYIDQFDRENAAIEASLKEYITLSDDQERAMAEGALKTHADYRKSIVELASARSINSDIGWIDRNVSNGKDRPTRAALVALAETSRKNIQLARLELEAKARNRLYLQTGVAAAAGACLLAFGWFLASGIRRRIDTFSQAVAKVAENDLSVRVEDGSHDEVGQLAESFQYMVNGLKEMVGTLSDSSQHLAVSSDEMQNNAQHMASAAEEVAAQAVAVATAGEEMSSTAADIARNCLLAAESAQRANEAAGHGSAVVDTSIEVMQRISQRVQVSAATVEELGRRSDQIGSIVSTIEDIADQTNLLALNAAIEAARAGDHGRGFAVVADEVRALAEKTAHSTHEIGTMIQAIQRETCAAVSAMTDGVNEVEVGTREAARSGEALRLIQDEINRVNLQVQQIATAAEEQTATTCEISSNIHRITETVQETADGARTTLAIAEGLSRLSQELTLVVSEFSDSQSDHLIEWGDRYSVGVSEMDSEHQRLVELINDLNRAMHSGMGKKMIGSVLDELIAYTVNHFAHEERLMREAGYPEYEGHKRLHEELAGKALEIQRKYHAGSGSALSQEVMTFLVKWLVNHIQGMDKPYGPYVRCSRSEQRSPVRGAVRPPLARVGTYSS